MNHNILHNVFAPKYYSLFPYLAKCGDNIVDDAGHLKMLMQTKEPDKQALIADYIKNAEKTGENLKEVIYSILNNLIILPFDREDINELLNKTDDLLESIVEIGQIVNVNKHTEIFASYAEMSDLIGEAAAEISGCLKSLKDIEGNKHKMYTSCNTLIKLYKDAEDVYYEGILDIFSRSDNATALSVRKMIFEAFMECIKGIKSITESFRTILIKVM
ncbi:MAG: DUF47 family protein [Bacteroidales bacterium]|nr:DUF47 family protein [Bacteroidales bacterium]